MQRQGNETKSYEEIMKDLKNFDIVQQGWGVKDLNAGNTHF